MGYTSQPQYSGKETDIVKPISTTNLTNDPETNKTITEFFTNVNKALEDFDKQYPDAEKYYLDGEGELPNNNPDNNQTEQEPETTDDIQIESEEDGNDLTPLSLSVKEEEEELDDPVYNNWGSEADEDPDPMEQPEPEIPEKLEDEIITEYYRELS